MRGHILYILGPTASGKTAVSKILQDTYGFAEIKTTTTRPKRDNADESSINFVSMSDLYLQDVHDNILEQEEYAGNIYATRLSDVEKASSKSVLLVKVIGIGGLEQLMLSELHNSGMYTYSNVYLQPIYEGYEQTRRGREGYKERDKQDDKNRERFNEVFLPYTNSHVLNNEGSIQTLATTICQACLFDAEKEWPLLNELISLPRFAELVPKGDDAAYFASIRLSPMFTITYFIRSKEYFNVFRYYQEMHPDRVVYEVDNNMCVSFAEHGIVVTLTKL